MLFFWLSPPVFADVFILLLSKDWFAKASLIAEISPRLAPKLAPIIFRIPMIIIINKEK